MIFLSLPCSTAGRIYSTLKLSDTRMLIFHMRIWSCCS